MQEFSSPYHQKDLAAELSTKMLDFFSPKLDWNVLWFLFLFFFQKKSNEID